MMNASLIQEDVHISHFVFQVENIQMSQMMCLAVRCGAMSCLAVRCGVVRCGAVLFGAMHADCSHAAHSDPTITATLGEVYPVATSEPEVHRELPMLGLRGSTYQKRPCTSAGSLLRCSVVPSV
ncbi:hypothetical protein ACOMHN_051860 [Nucella lapillus]